MENRVAFIGLCLFSLVIYIAISIEIRVLLIPLAIVIGVPVVINLYTVSNKSSKKYVQLPQLQNREKITKELNSEKKKLNITNENILHNKVITDNNQNCFYRIIIIVILIIIFLKIVS